MLAVGGFDGGIAFGGAAHGDEREAAGAAGGVIGHESDFRDGPVLIEQVFEVVLGGIEGKISYVQFHYGWFELWNGLPWLSCSREFGFQITTEKIHRTIHHATRQEANDSTRGLSG